MSYERPTKGMRYMGVDIGYPAVTFKASHLRNKIPQHDGYGSSHEKLSAVAQAQLDFQVRRDILNEWCVKLVNAAKEHWKPYPTDIKAPKGFAEAGLLQHQDVRIAGYRVEALISLYLDGLYIIYERVWDAICALHSDSGGTLWPGVSGLAKTRFGRPVVTLFPMMRGSSNSAKNIADKFERAIEVRGTRVHAHHYQVDLTHFPADEHPVVCYHDRNPYEPQKAVVHFSDKDRAGWSAAMFDTVDWFTAEAEKMLAAETSVSTERTSDGYEETLPRQLDQPAPHDHGDPG